MVIELVKNKNWAKLKVIVKQINEANVPLILDESSQVAETIEEKR